MSEFDDKISPILDRFGSDYAAAAAHVHKSRDRKLILFVLQIGIETLAARRRAMQRKRMRATIIKPSFTSGARGPKVVFTARTRRRLEEGTITLFTSWKIGKTDLGKATKAKLLQTAAGERASGAGHFENALFYETLAAPMSDHETVADHWRDEEAVKLIRDEIWKDDGRGGPGPRPPGGEVRPPP